jgi:hypothetical protein
MSTAKLPKLRVEFNGLCAFVPRSGDQKPPMDVLLVNASHSHAKKLSRIPAPHFPLLKFNLSSLRDFPASDGDAEGMWALEDEDIFFKIKTGSRKSATEDSPRGGVEIVDSSLQSEAPSSPAEEKDFKWVPQLAKILPGEEDIHPSCMASNPSSGSLVISRFHLTGGTISTKKVGEFFKVPVVAQFVPGPPGGLVRQAIAHSVLYEVELPKSATVVIQSQNFGDQRNKRSLTLVPQDDGTGSGQKVIDVEVTNLCCGFYLEKTADGSKPPEPDDDFECFYILCKNFPDTRPKKDVPFSGKYTRLPVPSPAEYPMEVPPLSSDVSGGVDPIRCTMVRFNKFG